MFYTLRRYPVLLLLLPLMAGAIVLTRPTPYLPVLPNRAQTFLVERYKEWGIREDVVGTLEALTLGYKADLDKDVKRHFARSGAAHVLAVSGLHVGIVYGIILALLTGLGYWKPLYEERKQQAIVSGVCIALLFGFAYVTGFSPSVTRSVVMCSVLELSYVFQRNRLSVNGLLVAALVILACVPEDIYSVSFQLSFSAVLSILLFQPLIDPFVRPLKRGKISRYFVDLVSVSIAAQIGTLPLCLYYFHQISNWFILTNLVVIPCVGILVGMTFLMVGLGVFSTEAARLTAEGLNRLLDFLHLVVARLESLPGAVTEMEVSPWMMVCLYGAIAGAYVTLKGHLYGLIPYLFSLSAFVWLYLQV